MYLWPPLWLTGIRFDHISHDFHHIRMTMALRFYNKNLHGIQYGGNLYSMTDPCHIIMILRNLGPSYRVLDKSAQIEFIKPGTSKVTANCIITEEDLVDIKEKTAGGEKYFKDFSVDIKDEAGELVATVIKTIYVRQKRPSTPKNIK
jgi:acyl-coenzyme A thioesterase PaaI-like protein